MRADPDAVAEALAPRGYELDVEAWRTLESLRKELQVRAQDLEGETWEFSAEDFMARVIQHEVDHLNGILFIDHLSSLKRALYKKKLKKILQEQQED